MKLDDLKFSEIMQLMSQFDEVRANMQKSVAPYYVSSTGVISESNEGFWQIGKSYFIRTVTMYCLGKLKAINSQELLMENASWVADCGRFHEAQKTGKLNEVEPFVNDVILNRSSIIDATLWNALLPTQVI